MLRLGRLLALPMIAAGLLLVCNANEAQAQIRVQIGGFGFNGGGGYRGGVTVYRGGHHFSSNRHSVYRPRYGVHRYGHYNSPRIQSYGHHGYYHDTSHFDYHAPQIYRHGNHYDFVPGHYDFHRTGHYHH